MTDRFVTESMLAAALERVATKDDLHAMSATLRAEMRTLNDETRAAIGAEMRALNAETRAEIRAEMRALNTETRAEIRAEMRALNDEVRNEMRGIEGQVSQVRVLVESLSGDIRMVADHVASQATRPRASKRRP